VYENLVYLRDASSRLVVAPQRHWVQLSAVTRTRWSRHYDLVSVSGLTWTDVFLAGIGLDVAGAVVIAWSLAATTAEKLSHDIPIHGISFGLPHMALGSARQRAEARLGIVLLGGGFLLQGLAYFFPHPRSSLNTNMQRLVGLGILVGAWVMAIIAYRMYVGWSTARTYDRAQRMQPRE
jgi:hypothetical protein